MYSIGHFPNPHLRTDASNSDQNAYQKYIADSEVMSCIMLASMTTKLQMHHETMEAYDIVIHLKKLFDKHACNTPTPN